ncbi:MAG: CDP-diacylglycerol--serine O-phosphatidyltransferase [Syntrophobacterales bacterium]|jgi:CDP-diacylglycerol--serine O-phosphatidyltransferase|nr:CDP-diacylglycerol--serine O-phosphatidyltransferase [Syntrophobacterales bacterium]
MRKRKGKGIYILPNLLTSVSLFSGFYSMIATIDGRFTHAAGAIFISAVFDMLDGRVARLTGSSSRFGVEYDSLSDVIAFGVAPGLLAYMWALNVYPKFGWLAAFLYVACGALRLARFNVQADSVQKQHFLGLPIPAAASVIAGIVFFYSYLGFSAEPKTVAMPIIVYVLAFLMVSDVRYYSFKDMGFFKGKPFRSTVVAIMLLVIVSSEPQITLFIGTVGYALSGPIYTIFRRKKVILETESSQSKEAPAGRDGH